MERFIQIAVLMSVMKYDNTNETIEFVLPEALETYNKYVVYSNIKGTFFSATCRQQFVAILRTIQAQRLFSFQIAF